ncbi:MAG: hypothetical protein UHS49_06120, partial [Faecalimonas sp.]|nr:hypothetical protein [Faecalimonas sp.]
MKKYNKGDEDEMSTARDSFYIIGGKEYYRITDFTKMKPFLFTLATSSDLWIHLSTYGTVTAGRCNSDQSIFPYVVEDVMHHGTDTGSKTLVRVNFPDKSCMWQPFDTALIQAYETERNLYKSVLGNSVIFEEINHTLGLTFRYEWRTSNRYGFVRTASLTSQGEALGAEVLDGVMNILPYGVAAEMQRDVSAMVDGYKRAEMADAKGTTVFALTSAFADRPEAKEILKATFFWNRADFERKVYYYEDALQDFAQGKELRYTEDYIGERCGYLMNFAVDFAKDTKKEWTVVGDIGVTHSQIAEMCRDIDALPLEEDIKASEELLYNIVGMTDGMQLTGDKTAYAHHLSCVMYNDMRGGMFIHGYDLDFADFLYFVKKKNKNIYQDNKAYLETLKEIATIPAFKERLKQDNKLDLYRLCMEYIPVSFSRRHGDPSRPWNTFSIVLNDEEGNPINYYQGNWRDVFQNWEALCMSYPDFYENAIVKFMNNSTADAFNPLKIDKYGFEWETPADMAAFTSFGYSSDHQIIYLIRMVEWFRRFWPERVSSLFERDIFTYADSPYELTSFEEMVRDAKWTIRFNDTRHERVEAAVKAGGEDYKLVTKDGMPYLVSFAEKLAVQALGKISNLVVGGGVWMNTQKAEWNDANNAIVGAGLSVVTSCQLRHYLISVIELCDAYAGQGLSMSKESCEWLTGIIEILQKYLERVEQDTVDDAMRYSMLKECRYIYDGYKQKVYAEGFSEKVACTYDTILEFFRLALRYVEYTIRKNRREDGMYHSYNLMSFVGEKVVVRPLQLMLEGQVAVLDCGILDATEAATLLEAMEQSEIYSERDKSFFLYPVKYTQSFLTKNQIPERYVTESALIKRLLEDESRELVTCDETGVVRFSPEVDTVRALSDCLE